MQDNGAITKVRAKWDSRVDYLAGDGTLKRTHRAYDLRVNDRLTNSALLRSVEYAPETEKQDVAFSISGGR